MPNTYGYDVTLYCTLSVREPSYSAIHARRSTEDRLRRMLPGYWNLSVERSSADLLPVAPVPGDDPEEPTRPWQEGDEGVIMHHGGGHGFPIGEPVRMVGHSPRGSERWRSLRTGDRWSVPPDCVKPRETDPSNPTAWQVGDRFEVVDPRCNPFETGEVVELIEYDHDAQERYARRGYMSHRYRSVHTGERGVAKSHRLRRLDPHTITAGEMPGPVQAPADAPTPAPGEVWDVVTPNLPPGQVSRLYVEALTDRVVTLRLTDFKPIPERWAPRLGGGPMRYERDAVRFVERVQD